MGPITGLATIATALTVLMVVSAVVVIGLTLAVAVPAVRESRTDRRRRSLSIPRYYLHPAAAH
jgi:hypothetical protein